ncbi:MAG: TlpA disulfide reductase family protein, partial [Candidatus Sumerlaeota bacterium]|nr:TlpA disulfide reductase family protein [Candidatus Sumerlaeota bacterium]
LESLVQKVRGDEAWLWKANSFLGRFTSESAKSDQAVALRFAAQKQKFPNMDFSSTMTQTILLGEPQRSSARILLAWDAKRLAWLSDKEGVALDRRVFDGHEARMYEKQAITGQEHYALDQTVVKLTPTLLTSFNIGRVTSADVWWNPSVVEAHAYTEPPLCAFEDLGVKLRDGRSYRVIANRLPNRTGVKQEWWISQDSGRLAFLKVWTMPAVLEDANALEMKHAQCVLNRICAAASDGKTSDVLALAIQKRIEKEPTWPTLFIRQFEMERMKEVLAGGPGDFAAATGRAWLRVLKGEDALGVHTDEFLQTLERKLASRPSLLLDAEDQAMADLKKQTGFEYVLYAEYGFEDWREAAPGRFFPFRQTETLFMIDPQHAGAVESTRVTKAAEIQVDKPLADDLFTLEFKEGVQVFDWSHQPMLIYPYKKHFTDEEWKQIEAQAEDMEKRRQELTKQSLSMLNKPAQPILSSGWLNGGPVSLEERKGKLTILHFFAEWSAPSRDEVDQAVAWRKKHSDDPAALVGIHPPGGDPARLEAFVKERRIDYPVAIDEGVREGAPVGKTTASYIVTEIPRALLVGEDGKVVAEGKLADVLQEADKRLGGGEPKKEKPASRP